VEKGDFEPCERGILIPSGDAVGLARALLFLVEHPEACLRMGQAGRDFVTHRFSQERLVQDIHHLYQELLQR
jgi:glycosyltransferase involved in cell wall biosynthesis